MTKVDDDHHHVIIIALSPLFPDAYCRINPADIVCDTRNYITAR